MEEDTRGKATSWTIRGGKWIEGEESLGMCLGNYKPREDYGLDSGTNIDSTSSCKDHKLGSRNRLGIKLVPGDTFG